MQQRSSVVFSSQQVGGIEHAAAAAARQAGSAVVCLSSYASFAYKPANVASHHVSHAGCSAQNIAMNSSNAPPVIGGVQWSVCRCACGVWCGVVSLQALALSAG